MTSALHRLIRAAGAAGRLLGRLRRDRAGSYSMIVALLLPVLCGFVSLGTEVGLWFYDQQIEQTAADTAAFSAAAYFSGGAGSPTAANAQTQAIAVARNYGFGAAAATCSGTTSTTSTCATTGGGTSCNIAAPATGTTCVQVNTPPLYGNHTSASCTPSCTCPSTCYFEVVIAQRPQQLFSAVLTSNPVTILARAVGQPGGDCLIALDTSIAGAVQASGGTQSLNNCSIAAKSNNADAIYMSAGTITAASAVTAGNKDIIGTAAFTMANGTTTSAAQSTITDPYSSLATPTSGGTCVASGTFSGSVTTTLAVISGKTAGLAPPSGQTVCAMGGIASTGTLTLASGGVYIIGGSLTISGGSLTGSGVTLIITKNSGGTYGTVQITGGNVTLSAPSSGTTAGISIYQDRNAPLPTYSGTPASCTGNCNHIACSAACSSVFAVTGAIYLPQGNLTYGGATGSNATSCTQIVVDSITFEGTASSTLNFYCSGQGLALVN